MTKIVGVSGALRKGSYNAALLRAAASMVPASGVLDVASIAGIPLYDGDVEAEHGIPAPVADLKQRIARADGLLLVTPEYNQSIPGVFKNAIDWLSRPAKDIKSVFGGKAVGLIGATPGPGGTRLSQTAWLPVLRALGLRPWFEKQLYVAGAGQVFDGDGNLVDDKIRSLLSAYVEGFFAYASENPSRSGTR